MDHLPSDFSGGQQRAWLGPAALVTNAMILPDEPTGGLATKSAEDVLGVFERMRRGGRTIVLITRGPDAAKHPRRGQRPREGEEPPGPRQRVSRRVEQQLNVMRRISRPGSN
jgi:putative ABC transport system ATP-binding protein